MERALWLSEFVDVDGGARDVASRGFVRVGTPTTRSDGSRDGRSGSGCMGILATADDTRGVGAAPPISISALRRSALSSSRR
jgi:hypothetical protein